MAILFTMYELIRIVDPINKIKKQFLIITAFSITPEEDRRVVIELFYNATESMNYSTKGISRHQEIYALLDNMNRIVMKKTG